MTKKYMKFKTKGTCSREIHIETDGDIIKNVEFVGGCNGNTQGIASLVKGMRIQDVIDKTEGISCNGRGTSCPDQLSKALKELLASKNV